MNALDFLPDFIYRFRIDDLHDMPQEDFARLIGCSQSQVSKIESGENLPPSEVLLRFCRVVARRGSRKKLVELSDFIWGKAQ